MLGMDILPVLSITVHLVALLVRARTRARTMHRARFARLYTELLGLIDVTDGYFACFNEDTSYDTKMHVPPRAIH